MVHAILKDFISTRPTIPQVGTFPMSKSSPTSSNNLYSVLSPCSEAEHKLKLFITLPKPSPIYKLSPLEDETLKKHLGKAMEKNLIRIPKSTFVAAVLFIQKKDGSLQFVTDYLVLNAITVKNHYPLPFVSNLLVSLAELLSFIKFDLAAGYN